jgi:antirestriction protein ArdC
MPAFAHYRSPESYYSTSANEVTHWSGAKHRLGRELTIRFGTEVYAAEELIAELGAVFTCARLELLPSLGAITLHTLRRGSRC